MKVTHSKKSQAAMEFLMTYGWAILVVLAAIAALAYFGVLSPEKILPSKCLLETGFTCISNKIEPTKSTIIFSNSLGRTVEITSVDIGGCSSGTISKTITSGDQDTFEVTPCTNGVVKEAFKGDLVIKYTESDTSLTKTAYGQIATKIE
tara:strand:+ start:3907 stop:4353 length:447 start_codon:yes stop_codon:yes gene_type:complete